MGDNTLIEWADATVNAVNGCSVHSPGCANCYAMKLAGTRLRNHPTRAGLTVDTKAGPVWTGEVRLNEAALLQPLRWKRPRRIFWNAHGDLFHDAVPDEWIDRVFAICALTPQHTHMILTKRSARMRDYAIAMAAGNRFVIHAGKGLAPAGVLADRMSELAKANPACSHTGPLPNVWLGVSVEDQARADERIPDLLATPAAVRFISAEPLLGPVDLTAHLWGRATPCADCPKDAHCGCGFFPRGACPNEPALGWVIAGGESGPGARPMHPGWARGLRDQCEWAGVPFFFKQWGEYEPIRHDHIPYRQNQLGWVNQAGKLIMNPTEACYRAMDRDDDRLGRSAWTHIAKVGKARAGRLLDGREWNGMPGDEIGAGRGRP